MRDLEKKLNERWKIIKTKIEKELNKNCKPFGDLMPGNFYHVPLITSIQTDLSKQPWAGGIRDFQIKQEDVENPPIKLKRLYGITACSHIADKTAEEMEQAFFYFLLEIKLTLANTLKFDYNQPSHGYYIKISDLKEDDNAAAFGCTIESNLIPVVQIGRSPKDYLVKGLK